MKPVQLRKTGYFIITLLTSLLFVMTCDPVDKEIKSNVGKQSINSEKEINVIIKRAEVAEERMAELTVRLENIESELGNRNTRVTELEQQLASYRKTITLFIVISIGLLSVILYNMRAGIRQLIHRSTLLNKLSQRMKKKVHFEKKIKAENVSLNTKTPAIKSTETAKSTGSQSQKKPGKTKSQNTKAGKKSVTKKPVKRSSNSPKPETKSGKSNSADEIKEAKP